MNETSVITAKTGSLSEFARNRMLSVKGEPLFHADWLRAVFIHYEVDAGILQREVPFELDLWEGKAYLSLVAFMMRGMRPRIGGKLTALAFKPISTHEFLNVRAYVKRGGEPGIYFLAEWLSNPLSVHLGPPLFGLPYRFGRIRYQHDYEDGNLRGLVTDKHGAARLEYISRIDPAERFEPCDAGSLDEFLLERYTAFTARGSMRRFFRIWHPPWPQTPTSINVPDLSLLIGAWPWFKEARLVGANFSPGIERVWMGRLQRLAE